METNENTTQSQSDEISLIDLLVVLIRYRKLIIGITLCGFILAIAGYLIYPVYQYNRAQKNMVVEGTMVIGVKPAAMPWISERIIAGFFNSPEVILSALQQAGLEFIEDGELKISLADQNKRTEALYYLRQRFIKNENQRGNIYKDLNSRIFEIKTLGREIPEVIPNITVMFKYKDAALVVSFLENILIQGELRVAAYVHPQAVLLVDSYERYFSAEAISQTIRQNMELNFDTYLFAKAFLAGEETVLMEVTPPELKPQILLETLREQFIVKGVVLVFVMFFLAVFLAFFLNAIQKIKHDETAMQKINEALGKHV